MTTQGTPCHDGHHENCLATYPDYGPGGRPVICDCPCHKNGICGWCKESPAEYEGDLCTACAEALAE